MFLNNRGVFSPLPPEEEQFFPFPPGLKREKDRESSITPTRISTHPPPPPPRKNRKGEEKAVSGENFGLFFGSFFFLPLSFSFYSTALSFSQSRCPPSPPPPPPFTRSSQRANQLIDRSVLCVRERVERERNGHGNRGFSEVMCWRRKKKKKKKQLLLLLLLSGIPRRRYASQQIEEISRCQARRRHRHGAA
jgi:hypothetical protein